MNLFDVILLVPLLYGAYKGFREGLILELFSILALILAFIGGFKLLHVVMEFMRDSWDMDGSWLPIIAFALIFVGIIILTNMAGKAISGILNMTFLGVFDKIGGAVLALFKWAFGISVLLWVLLRFNISLPDDWQEGSLLYPYLEPMADKMWELIEYLLPVASDFFESIREFNI
jgi:membrane protein required for colicin V production